MLLVSVSGFCQQDFASIEISFSKTTSIVFPYAIKSVDKGSADVLVQKARGVENILLVKAGIRDFAQTNLTVVTSDGRLYSYILNYDEQCPVLHVTAETGQLDGHEVLFPLENENQKRIEVHAKLALSKKKKISGLYKSRYQIRIQVNGIFIHQDMMYFRVVLENKSKITYDVDQLRFFIRDQKKAVRTASQEIEIEPVYATSKASQIPDVAEVSMVYAIPKFTIPEKKILILQLIEQEGGRHLELEIRNSDLVSLDVL